MLVFVNKWFPVAFSAQWRLETGEVSAQPGLTMPSCAAAVSSKTPRSPDFLAESLPSANSEPTEQLHGHWGPLSGMILDTWVMSTILDTCRRVIQTTCLQRMRGRWHLWRRYPHSILPIPWQGSQMLLLVKGHMKSKFSINTYILTIISWAKNSCLV